MMSLLELFVRVDDFCQVFLPFWERKLIEDGSKKRQRAGQLRVSEIMTIIIYFHQSHYRTFKAYYTEHVCQHLRAEFPKLVSYERFVILMPSVLGPLSAYLKSLYGRCHGLSFIDSTALLVCDNHRIHNHKGYISQALFEQLLDTFGVQLITKLRKNMKNRLLPWMDKLLLRKRAIIESVVDQLKNISQIEHTRHRSPINCFINIIAGLIAYCLQPKKPSLHLVSPGLLSA